MLLVVTVDLVDLQENVLKFWRENRILQKKT